MRRDIALESTDAKQQREKRKDEGGLNGHEEMADGHQHTADNESRVASEPPVSDDPAEDWREINQRGVGAENRRGERLARGAVIDVRLQPIEADHLVHAPGHQQVIDHVQGQQRLHLAGAEVVLHGTEPWPN